MSGTNYLDPDNLGNPQKLVDDLNVLALGPMYMARQSGGLVGAGAGNPRSAASGKASPSPFDMAPVAARALPRDNYVGPLSDHAPMMFREAAPEEVVGMLSGQSSPYGRDEKFLADNPDIALGQGQNKGGIQLAFDASKIEGQVNRSKPGWEYGYQNGNAEYVGKDTTQNFQNALAAIRVPNTLKLPRSMSAQVNRGLQALLSNGWTGNTLDNGYTEYLPPADQGGQ